MPELFFLFLVDSVDTMSSCFRRMPGSGLANRNTRALSNHNLIVFLFFQFCRCDYCQVTSYLTHHCIELLMVKFTQVSSEKNLVKWKLSWGWESHCADTVSCQSVVTRIFNNLPVCLIPNLSKKSYPAATVLPFAKNLPLCSVTSDEDICIWLCVVTA